MTDTIRSSPPRTIRNLAASLKVNQVAAMYLPTSLILCLAFGLRLWDLNSRSLWFDESFEYWAAIVPLHSIPATTITTFQPPLFSILLHFWLMFGDQAAWLRLFSVGLSMFSLVGVMALAYQAAGRGGAIAAGLVMAVLPAEVRYAQEVGEYAMMECMLVWSIYFLSASLRRPSFKNLALWSLFSVLAVYSHYGTAVVIAATTLAALWENAWKEQWNSVIRQVIAGLGGLACGVPLFVYFLPHQKPYHPSPVAPFNNITAELGKLFTAVGDTFTFSITGWPFSHLPKLAILIPIYLALAFSLYCMFAKRPNNSKRLIAWFWIAFLFYYLMIRAGLYGYGNIGFRYAIILSPLFVLVITSVQQEFFGRAQPAWRGRNFLSLARYAITLGSVICVIGLAVYSLPNRTLSQVTRGGMAWPETEDMGRITQYWLTHHDQKDVVYVYYGALPAFRYYLRLDHYESRVSLPPTWYQDCWKKSQTSGLHTAACASNGIFYGEGLRTYTADQKVQSVQRTFGSLPRRFWIVFSHALAGEDMEILNVLTGTYRIVQSEKAQNASLYLLEEK